MDSHGKNLSAIPSTDTVVPHITSTNPKYYDASALSIISCLNDPSNDWSSDIYVTSINVL